MRTAGCDYRCTWCDTLYAVLPEHRASWQHLTVDQVWQQVTRLSEGRPLLVTLSGGNPALQPLQSLLDTGQAQGYTFALETQASHAPAWLSLLDHLVLSPKGPSAGHVTPGEQVEACLSAAGCSPRVCLKLVVFSEADYQWARELAAAFPQVPVYLQPGTTAGQQDSITPRVEWLLQQVVRDGWFQVRLLPQLHVLLWGSRRGV